MFSHVLLWLWLLDNKHTYLTLKSIHCLPTFLLQLPCDLRDQFHPKFYNLLIKVWWNPILLWLRYQRCISAQNWPWFNSSTTTDLDQVLANRIIILLLKSYVFFNLYVKLTQVYWNVPLDFMPIPPLLSPELAYSKLDWKWIASMDSPPQSKCQDFKWRFLMAEDKQYRNGS